MSPAADRRAADHSTAIIGRDREIHELEGLLASPSGRLVTVTGPPGVGKSRLARVVSSRSTSRFADGVHAVDLSATATTGQALAELARCCGATAAPGSSTDGLTDSPATDSPATRIGHRLRDRSVLLLLDGCEHLPGLGRELGTVLAVAPRVKVLATSRARFRLACEVEYPVPPLAMPGPELVGDLDRLGANDAVRLLLQRARLVRPGFELDADNAGAVRPVCVRADGLPLVIELLAARLATFSPQELAVRVRNRQVLLDSAAARPAAPSPRHRTLRAAIGWSHGLLGPAERRLLRTVSVFPGSWTLEAAEQLLDDPDVDVPSAAATLVGQSLVQRADADTDTAAGTYRLLDSVREFATEQLQLHGEQIDVQRRHTAYHARLATAAEAGFGTRDETVAQAWVRSRHIDLRMALEHALADGDTAAALPLAAATGWFEFSHGFPAGDQGAGAQDLVEQALLAAAGPAEAALDPDLVAGTLLVSGVLAERHGRLALAATRLRESLTLSEGSGDLRRQAIAHAFLGHVARRGHSYGDAANEYRRALAVHEVTGNHHSRAWAWVDLGLLALEQGDLDAADTHLRRARTWFQDADEAWPLGWALWASGETRLRRGAVGDAAGLFADAVSLLHQVDDLRGVASCLEGLAAVASRRGTGDTAARLLGTAAWVRESLRTPPAPVSAATVAATRDALTGLLGPAEATRAARAGASLSLDAALELATSLTGPSAGTPPSPLSRRQREVAVLVAEGRTNRQIATALGITEKTVEVHLTQAMRRLGAHNRSEVAVHAADAGLRGAP